MDQIVILQAAGVSAPSRLDDAKTLQRVVRSLPLPALLVDRHGIIVFVNDEAAALLPTAAPGLRVNAFATGLKHPRWLQVLPNGDVLVAEDGSLVRVIAAPQPVLVVRHCAEHGSPFDLLRAAYHLGNRHVPVHIVPTASGGTLRFQTDHVLAEMVRGLGCRVGETDAPFEPEAGAYGAASHRGHHYHHGDDRALGDLHDPGHGAHRSANAQATRASITVWSVSDSRVTRSSW